MRNAGIKLSVSVISGLGGKEQWQEHAVGTARVLSAINPDYIGLLTLVVEEGTPLHADIQAGDMTLLTPIEVMHETRLMVENLELSGNIFRGNHASNYLPFAATLDKEKERLVSEITQVINSNPKFRDDSFRSV